ncbi:hypothetical protein pb186bvf_020014 [Paramecium bursaria]
MIQGYSNFLPTMISQLSFISQIVQYVNKKINDKFQQKQK